MRTLLVVMAALVATPAMAEPARGKPVRPKKPAAAHVATAAVDTTATPVGSGEPTAIDRQTVPQPAMCSPLVPGRHRHRACALPTIVVSTEAPAPGVLIVDPGPRVVVGRPRTDDRLTGLPRHF